MADKIRFGVYELDQDAVELRKRGVPIRLQEQPFRVLVLLAERRGEVVTREELQKQIWGNTFVDFDQSLNKAINRIREALNDDANTPQYVETVPRRGYRFIAPVMTTAAEAPSPPAPTNPGPIEVPEQGTRSFRRAFKRSWTFPLAGLAIVALLAAIAIAIFARWRQPRDRTPQDARLITSFGWQPALSRDGKLLARTSSVGDEAAHIWVQQTAGGEAIPITTGPDFDELPDFSPDGTRIAFYSARAGGGIYTTSTLPGEPKLLVGIPNAVYPRFSPNGDSILYWQAKKAFTVPVDGGQPVSLPVNQDFTVYSPPLWSPAGTEILFYGSPRREPNKPASWWIAPLGPGSARPVNLPRIEQNYRSPVFVHAWVRTADEREWIVYSITKAHSWKLCRIRISARGAMDETPEIIASGNGSIGSIGAVARDGKLAYTMVNGSASIYQVSVGDRGQKPAPTLQLPLPEAGFHTSPSVSHDGGWMAYVTDTPGKPDIVVLRNLTTGREHLLDDDDRQTGGDVVTSISPDGSRVIFQRDCQEALFRGSPDRFLPCGFMIPPQVERRSGSVYAARRVVFLPMGLKFFCRSTTRATQPRIGLSPSTCIRKQSTIS